MRQPARISKPCKENELNFLLDLDLKEITNDYHAVNKLLNNSGANNKDHITIFCGSEETPKHLATIDKGKVITAAPELMTKIWLDPGGPLGKKIGRYMINKQKNASKDQTTKIADNSKQKTKRGKRLGI